MELPALVADHLEGEPVRERVRMDGDEVVVTPTRTLVYRSEGLLSDEAVSSFPNDVDRLDVSGGRKTTVEFTYLDGERSFRVGGRYAEDVLRAVLSGVLAATGVVGPDEDVRDSYRFDDLTFVLTDDRALKHVGGAVWDEEYESYPFADVTGLSVEEGVHATGLVVEVAGRPQRVKVPAEEARLVQRALEEAVCAHHGVDSTAALAADVADPDEEAGDEDRHGGFDAPGVEPLVATGEEPVDDRSATGGGEEPSAGDAGAPDLDLPGAADPAAGEDASSDAADEPADLAAEVAALREAVEEHDERLRAQEAALDRLAAELREDSRS